MARQVLVRGSFANDHAHAESFYSAAGKINDMTADIYARLSHTISVGEDRFSAGATTEARGDLAILQALLELASYVEFPAFMLPYDITLMNQANLAAFHATGGRLTREGGDPTEYDLLAYGANFLGTADATSPLQTAENARAITGGILNIPPGSFRIDGTVSAGASSVFWRGTPSSILLANNPNGPAVDFSRAGNFIKYLVLENLRINANIAGHRVPLISLGRSGQSLSRFVVRNLILDGVNLNRDGLRVIDSFDGLFQFVTLENFQAGGPAIRVESPTLNTGQLHFDTCQSTTNPVFLLVNENPQGNAMTGMHVDNCKLARRTDLSTNKFFAGTVAVAGASLGATSIPLTAGQGANYAAGDWIVVDGLTNQIWLDKIASVVGDTINLTATGGVPFALSSGHPVIVGNWLSVLGPNTRGVVFTAPQNERTNGICMSGVNMTSVKSPQIGPTCKRYAYLMNANQGTEILQPNYVINPSASDIVLHQSAGSGNIWSAVEGPITTVSVYPTPIQRDAGTMVAYRGRAAGLEQLLGVWHQDTTVAASQTNVQITGPNGSARSLAMISAGTMYALNVRVSTPRSAGSLTATVYKGGVAQTLTAVIDGSNTQNKLTEFFNGQQFGFFSPGNLLDVRITTSSDWAPTANDVDVSLYVSQ